MSGTVEKRLGELGLVLPEIAEPVGAYLPAAGVGNVVHSSGQLPMFDGTLQAVGKVGNGPDLVGPDQATALARLCALNALAAIQSVLPDLDRVTQVVKVVGFVASDPDFAGQSSVVNGASELLGAAFGENGRHARSAVGVAALPMNAPVEIEVVVAFT